MKSDIVHEVDTNLSLKFTILVTTLSELFFPTLIFTTFPNIKTSSGNCCHLTIKSRVSIVDSVPYKEHILLK